MALRQTFHSIRSVIPDLFWQKNQLLVFLASQGGSLPVHSPRWKSPLSFALSMMLLTFLLLLIANYAIILLESSLGNQVREASEIASESGVTFSGSLAQLEEHISAMILPATLLYAGIVFGKLARNTDFSTFSGQDAYLYFATAKIFWINIANFLVMELSELDFSETRLAKFVDASMPYISLFSYSCLIGTVSVLCAQLSALSRNAEGCRASVQELMMKYFAAQIVAVFVVIISYLGMGYVWYSARLRWSVLLEFLTHVVAFLANIAAGYFGSLLYKATSRKEE